MDLPGEVLNSLAQLLAALSIVLPLPLAFRLSCIVLPSGVSSMPIRNQGKRDQKSSKGGCLYAVAYKLINTYMGGDSDSRSL